MNTDKLVYRTSDSSGAPSVFDGLKVSVPSNQILIWPKNFIDRDLTLTAAFTTKQTNQNKKARRLISKVSPGAA